MDTYKVTWTANELRWTPGPEQSMDKPICSLRESQIVCIVRNRDASAGYTVYGLVEEDENRNSVSGPDPNPPFRLVTCHVADVPVQSFQAHIVHTSPPTYLGHDVDITVIVSTRSGTGRAEDFYQLVLAPLLEAIAGIRARSAYEDRDRSAVRKEEVGGAVAPRIPVLSSLARIFGRGKMRNGTVTPRNAADGRSVRGRDDVGYDLLVTESALSIRQFAQRKWQRRAAQQQRGHRIQQQAQTIILLSGDGGVVDLLNGFSDPPATDLGEPSPLIAVLPLGTGNALFSSHHKMQYENGGGGRNSGSISPSQLVLGLRTLLRTGLPVPLPVFRADFSPGSKLIVYSDSEDPPSDNSSSSSSQQRKPDDAPRKPKLSTPPDAPPVSTLLGAVVASHGFHAQLVWESDTPAYRRFGDKRFGMVASELMGESHAYRCDVTLVHSRDLSGTAVNGPAPTRSDKGDGHEEAVPGPFGYVLAAMVSNLERAFTISPRSLPPSPSASPATGTQQAQPLHLIHFPPVPGTKMQEIMGAAYRGGAHVTLPPWHDDVEANGDVVRAVAAGGSGQEKRVRDDAVKEVAITTHEDDARWRKVCVDGSIVELPKGGSIRVRTLERGPFYVLVDRVGDR